MKICPSCNNQIEDDSFFCEYCGNQLASYSSIASYNSGTSASHKKGKKGVIIALSILLGIAVAGSVILGYSLYSFNLRYDEQITIAQNAIDNLQEQRDSAISECNSYKKKYEDVNKRYNDVIATNKKLKSSVSTFESLLSTLEKVTPTNRYGGFQSKIIAIKKGETEKFSFPYTFNGYIVGWSNDYGYSFSWLSPSVNTRKFEITGNNVGVYILTINHSDNNSDGGIQTIIYVYE